MWFWTPFGRSGAVDRHWNEGRAGGTSWLDGLSVVVNQPWHHREPSLNSSLRSHPTRVAREEGPIPIRSRGINAPFIPSRLNAAPLQLGPASRKERILGLHLSFQVSGISCRIGKMWKQEWKPERAMMIILLLLNDDDDHHRRRGEGR